MESLVLGVAGDVWATLVHNWPFLLGSVVVATLVQTYGRTQAISRWIRRRAAVAVLLAVAVASLTPFCSCGTMAVVLGGLASSVPWAPLVAFLVSSPLTSPSELVLSAGVFGTAFAVTYFVGAIGIGLFAGGVGALVDRTGVLAGQARMQAAPALVAVGAGGAPAAVSDGEPATAGASGGGPAPAGAGGGACGCATATVTEAAVAEETVQEARPVAAPAPRRPLLRTFAENLRRLLIYFVAFAAIGYALLRVVPTDVLTGLLGDGPLAVPLAALLGMPIFLSSEGSLPLVASLMEGGMNPGAAMAFLVTGAGTSIGALSGLLVIARWRVVVLVLGTLLAGAILLGWVAQLWL